MIEKHASLRSFARRIGIHHATLKRWIEEELGILFPPVRQGSKLLVTEADVLKVLARRRDIRNLPPLDCGRKKKNRAA